MNLHAITATPEPVLAAALARFEEQFTYPLGPERSFRISHGEDYPRFYRAVGEAVCFVAERDGDVLGVLCLAVTRVRTADGSAVPAIYLGDLKVTPTARGGRVLPRLAEAAGEWCRGRAACGFGVVMDGTPVTPDRYTGRLGIPQFREAAKIAVLRIPVLTSPLEGEVGEALRAGWGVRPLDGSDVSPPTRLTSFGDLPLKGGGQNQYAGWHTDSTTGAECFARLAAGRIHTDGGIAAERSETPPQWLVSPDGSACGRVEDTRRAKRLIVSDGSEMLSAHLSCIGYANHAALAELLRAACGIAGDRGFPALFAAVPACEAEPVLAQLNEPGAVVAPATVFASGFPSDQVWSINTAEI